MSTESSPATVVAVAGSTGLDVTLRDPPRHWIGEVPRDVYTHRTLLPLHSPPEMGLGGNGGSASYVLGKLGPKVHLNAPIGRDPAGQLVRGWLERAGVTCTAPTGRSTMQAITAVDAAGRRLGTLQHVGPPLDWNLSARDREATWLLASLPGQVPVEALPRVLNLLQNFGGPERVRVLDTGLGWTGKAEPGRVRELWAHAEVVVGTLEELTVWTSGRNGPEVAERVLAAGPHTVVLKMGSGGAAYQSIKEPFAHQPPVRVASSNVSIGAGDAFNGALISALVDECPLPEAVARGQRIAARVVEKGRGVLGWGENLA
ncbi:MAG: carbohydrate kinase family protein [Acidobacteria bacterium]|nr:carbohydrate kinase family protein [Acidobacteriota bacterium]